MAETPMEHKASPSEGRDEGAPQQEKAGGILLGAMPPQQLLLPGWAGADGATSRGETERPRP